MIYCTWFHRDADGAFLPRGSQVPFSIVVHALTFDPTCCRCYKINIFPIGGAVAQLGARLDGIEEAVGSNPIGSTSLRSEAMKRERQIKSWKDREMIGKLVSASRRNREGRGFESRRLHQKKIRPNAISKAPPFMCHSRLLYFAPSTVACRNTTRMRCRTRHGPIRSDNRALR
jgi:hypothetical protein